MSGIFDQVINYAPPSLLLGTVTYKGTWSAATNTPTLLNPPSSITNGNYYVVSAAGTQFSLSFNIGDWIISNGSAWEKVDNTDAVSSVFGRMGAVVGVSTDYSAVGITNTALGASNPSTVAATTITASSTIAATGAVTGSNLSGTNTGDQTITLTGGVTGSGTGSFAATVVTNANLTGVITSSGNATSIASQTGTGTKFVVDTSPTLVTPNIGVATGTSLAAALNGTLGATTPSTIAATTISATGITSITNSTASTSTTTGALVVAGGVGVAGAAFIGSTLNVTGSAGINGSAVANVRLYIAGTSAAGSATASVIQVIEAIDSSKTSQYIAYNSRPYTATAAFTLSDLTHFTANPFTFGVGSTVTIQTGFFATNNLTAATTNLGFRGAIAAASGRYNLYMDGTAQNYLLGKTGIGQTPSATDTLAVTGTTLLTGNTAITGTLSATGAISTTATAVSSISRTLSVGAFIASGNLNAFGFTPNSIGLSAGYNYSGGDAETNMIFGASSSSQQMRFQRWDGTTLTNVLTLVGTGNVGIGTTSPAYKLDIRNTTAVDTVIALGNSVDANITQLGKQSSTAYGASASGNAFLYSISPISIMSDSGSGVIKFSTGGNAEKMRIDSSGNVGIGTTAPSQKVSVGASSGTVGYGIEYTSTDQEIFSLTANLSTGEIRHFAFTNYYPTFYAQNAERMRINTVGDVLIGTTTTPTGAADGVQIGPAQSSRVFSIASNAASNQILFYSLSGLAGYITTNTLTTSYVSISDYRLKNTIAPMTGALAKVALLKPVTYKWNIDDSSGEGFVAHELAEVVPYAVSGEKDGKQMQGVDYGKITPLLTAAIQELSTRLAALESK